MTYAKKYSHLLYGNLKDIDLITESCRNTTIKALIILSKYLGCHEEFKYALKSYGIKLRRQDAFTCFTRLYTNNNSDLWQWYATIQSALNPNEKLLLEYLRLSGLRKEEGVISFNKIIELSKQNNLNSYLNDDGFLEHFQFKKLFLRGTKNVYLSIVPKSLIDEIAKSEPVGYNAIRKRLERRKMRSRICELRDAYGTFMVRNGLIKEEVDLLQGRIPPSIFIRHYWSPSFKELRDRTLAVLEKMETLNVPENIT
jgi:intergrase/recombinase